MTSKMNAPWKKTVPAVLLILMAGFAVYSNTFQVPFVLDDRHAIVENIAVKEPGKVFLGYKMGLKFIQNRMVAYLTFALNYQFGGLDVFGYHLVNLLIHLATALLAYALLRLTFRTPYFEAGSGGEAGSRISSTLTSTSAASFIPLFAALLFVIHPVQTQAVTYIVQRMASLTTLFYLLALVLYAKGRLRMNLSAAAGSEPGAGQPTPNRTALVLCFGGSVLAAVLAMKTKEIAFTLPLAAALYEGFFFQGPLRRRLLCLLPLLATLPLIPFTILGFLDIGEDETNGYRTPVGSAGEEFRTGTDLSRMDYLLTQLRVLVTYLRLMFLPVRQNLDYDYPVFSSFFTPEVFFSFLLLAALFGLAVYLFIVSRPAPGSGGQSARPLIRLVAFGIFWFFLTLSVESSLVPIRDVIMEHRLYLPFFGAATAFAAAFFLLAGKLFQAPGVKLPVAAAIVILALGIATYQRNQVWGNAISLWQDTVEKSPGKARPVNNLGKALEEAGRREEAFEAFARAIRLDPGYYKGYYNLADLYLVSDQPETALELLQTAIRLKPDFTEAYVSVGAALMRAGRFREVAAFLEENLERVADIAEARFYLGAAYAFLGNREAAMRELSVLSRLDPDYAANLAGMMGVGSGRRGPHGQR